MWRPRINLLNMKKYNFTARTELYHVNGELNLDCGGTVYAKDYNEAFAKAEEIAADKFDLVIESVCGFFVKEDADGNIIGIEVNTDAEIEHGDGIIMYEIHLEK